MGLEKAKTEELIDIYEQIEKFLKFLENEEKSGEK